MRGERGGGRGAAEGSKGRHYPSACKGLPAVAKSSILCIPGGQGNPDPDGKFKVIQVGQTGA